MQRNESLHVANKLASFPLIQARGEGPYPCGWGLCSLEIIQAVAYRSRDRPMTSIPASRSGCAGRRTIGSWIDLSRQMALRKSGSRRHDCFGRQPDSKPGPVEKLIEAARKHGRYGHRDATMILLAYRHGLRASGRPARRYALHHLPAHAAPRLRLCPGQCRPRTRALQA
jgi:hypothetical protein